MRIGSTRLLAIFACSTLAFSFSNLAVAQPPSRGPGGPGRGGPPNPQELFERGDQNDDGKLTKDEVPEFMWGRLSRADANDDGAVTREELAQAFRNRGGQRPDERRGPGGPGRPEGERGSDADRGGPDSRRGPAAGRGAPERGRGPNAGRGGPTGRPGPDARRGGPDGRPSREADRGGPDGRRRPDAGPGRPDGDRRPSRPDDARPQRLGPDGSQARRPTPPRGNPRSSSGRSFGPEAMFARLDRNNDGSISKKEFMAAAQRFRSSGGPQGMSRPGSGFGGPPWVSRGQGSPFGRRPGGGPPWATQSRRGFQGPPWAQHANTRGPQRGGPPGRGRGHGNASQQHRRGHSPGSQGGRGNSSRGDHRGGPGPRGHADIETASPSDVIQTTANRSPDTADATDVTVPL